MTDERLRDDERRARVTGDPVAECRWWVERARSGQLTHPDAVALVERMARGELDRERLALAAYAGHVGALALVEAETMTYAASVGDPEAVRLVHGDDVGYAGLGAWVAGLARWGVLAEVTAQLALARVLCDGVQGGWPMRPLSGFDAEPVDPTDVRDIALALDAAHELIRRATRPYRERADQEGCVVDALDDWERFHWSFGGDVADAMGCALLRAYKVIEPDAFDQGLRTSSLEVCEREQAPPRLVARAVKRAVADLALDLERGGHPSG